MRDFILEEKNSIYIIDLSITVEQLARAAAYLGESLMAVARSFSVGTKKQAQEAVKEAAEVTGQFFVNQRWLGGHLTNLQTIRRSVADGARIRGAGKDARLRSHEQTGDLGAAS